MSLQINVTELPAKSIGFGSGLGKSSTRDYSKEPPVNRNYNIITCQPISNQEQSGKRQRPPRLSPIKRGGFDSKKTNSTTFSQQMAEISGPVSNLTKSVDNARGSMSYQGANDAAGQASQKNLMNSSSVNYNFVSYTKLPNPETLSTLRDKNEKVSFKTKAIAEFSDLTRLMSPNFNPDFQSTYKSNPLSFRRCKGMCSTLCQTEKSYGVAKAFRKFK